MANAEKRPLKVFLCHASGDKPPVRELYKRLTTEGVDAWLDQEKLLPGQDWRMEIPRAVREADVVVICLSKKSITKEGYVQKEIKFALDIAEEKPEGTIFLIPARLEDCVVPERLNRWQWVDLYEENGFIKLLRSLKLRADAVEASVEPALYVDSAKETDRRLEQLYTEGLAAFYTEDWDRACQRFQSILSERPNHRNATEKLAEAERQRNLSKLYEQASAAVRSEDWESAIRILEELSQKSAEYKDAAQMLRDARKQKQLRELYTEARALHAAQKWEAVVRVFAQIGVIEPNYPDADGLLSSAQREAAELKRLADLNEQYGHALREMDSGNWYESRRLLEAVHKSQTGFLETEKLLRKVEEEIAKEEEKRKQNDQVNTLYEQAHGLLRSKKWRNALDKMEEIRKLDERFPDTDGIAEKAQKELAREEQEAERQNKLAALYAEAVKLVKEEKYQEALDKWGEMRAVDPKYPDRQWVARTAKRKLGTSARRIPIAQPNFSIQNMGIGWLILLAALGFGLARLVEFNLGGVFRVPFPGEFAWGVAGALQGLITALVLRRMEKEWKWKSLLVFGVCWAVVYPMVPWAFRERFMLLIVSMMFSLAPTISIVLASVWARRVRQWQTYVLIFVGWILAWVIGLSAADYINPVLQVRSLGWVFRDMLAGGLGLWITVDLLKSQSIEKTLESVPGEKEKPSDAIRLLLMVVLSIVMIRAIWGSLQFRLDIWGDKVPSPTQIVFYIVLGGLYGFVVAYALRKVIHNWKIRNSLVVILGWALGLLGALLSGLVNLEFIAIVILLCSLSVAAAIAWADRSIPPLKLTLILLCWALAWKYGSMLGGYLSNRLHTDYTWYFADAVTILLGLLATLAIYEYSSKRLVTLTLISMVGFGLGNYLGTTLTRMLVLDYRIETSIQYVLLGFIGGSAFELPSRALKKILIKGGICAAALVIGYFLASPLPFNYLGIQNIIIGLCLGAAFGLSTRRITNIVLMALLSSAIFAIIVSLPYSLTINPIIRGAWIGLVLGIGYAYVTRDLRNNESAG